MSEMALSLAGVYRPNVGAVGFAIPVFRDTHNFWVQDACGERVLGFRVCDVEASALLPVPG